LRSTGHFAGKKLPKGTNIADDAGTQALRIVNMDSCRKPELMLYINNVAT
jgi:hypothetical protein